MIWTGCSISIKRGGSRKHSAVFCPFLGMVQDRGEIQKSHKQDTKIVGSSRKRVTSFIRHSLSWMLLYCTYFSLINALCTHMAFKRRKRKSNIEKIFRWDIIKIHAITHFSADIKRGGSTQEYSAELFENLHQQVAKRPYRISNKRATDTDLFIFNYHERGLMLSLMREFANYKSSVTRETYWTEVC